MTKKCIYIEIAQAIAQEIRNRTWTECLPGKNLLAQTYQVNPRTILKALKILEEQELIRIEPARGCFIRKKEERPNTADKTVAIVETEGQGSFQRKQAHYQFFSKIAASYGYKAVFIGFDAALFQENPHLLLNYPVQGFYFRFGSLRQKQRLVLHEHHIPFSCCSKQYLDPLADYADCDHEKGIPLLLRYLKEMGHRRIAYLEFERIVDYRKYLDTMKEIFQNELKEDFDPELFMILDIPFEARQDQEFMRKNIRKVLLHLLRQKEAPSVIVCNHFFLSYMSQELKGLIKIPEELSLAFIGYDVNDEDPFYTGISYNLGKIDTCAFECLLKRLTGQCSPEPQHILVEGELLKRHSVAKGPYLNHKKRKQERIDQ